MPRIIRAIPDNHIREREGDLNLGFERCSFFHQSGELLARSHAINSCYY